MTPDFIRIPTNPIPEGGEVFDLAAPDGAPLRGAWFPKEQARGVVVLLTGWSEFIEKYVEAAADLNARGFSVAMMDWRGQGLSDRKTPRASGWRNYFDVLSDDLNAFNEQIARPRMPADGDFDNPILITHSMGGLPALMLMASGYDGFSRAVLSAPLTRLFPGFADHVVHGASSIACALGFAGAKPSGKDKNASGFAGNIYTADQARHERFGALKRAKPEAATESPTLGWVNAVTRASRRLHQPNFFDGLKTRILIVSAGLEQRVDLRDQGVIAAASPMIDRVVIEGALHEILVERDAVRDQFFSAFDDFIARKDAAQN
ncbi:MAG: alpha/beta hydrolase [Pseudomonadota bacterium]